MTDPAPDSAPDPAPAERSTVTLRALAGAPLDDPVVRRTVLAAARALAERTGVALTDVSVRPDALRATVGTSRLGAVGFAAELRRSTGDWYRARTGGADLWGGAEPGESGPGFPGGAD